MPTAKKAEDSGVTVALSKVPKQIANRIVTFSFAVTVQKSFLAPDVSEINVRQALLHKGQHVGHAGMVLDAEHDPLTHTVKIKPGSSCTVGIQLLRDDVDSVEIVILKPIPTESSPNRMRFR